MRRTRKKRQRGGHRQHPHLTQGYLSNKKISTVFTNQGRKWLKQHGGRRRKRQRGGDGTHPHLAQGFLEAGPQVPIPRSPKDQIGQAPKQPPKGQAPPKRKQSDSDKKGGRRTHRRRRRRTRRRRRRRGRGKNQAQRATSPNSVRNAPRAGNRSSIFKPSTTIAAPHHYGKLPDKLPTPISTPLSSRATAPLQKKSPLTLSQHASIRKETSRQADALIHQQEERYAKARGCRCAKCNERAAWLGDVARAPVGNTHQTLSPPPSPPIKVRKTASNKGGKRRRRRTRRKRRRRY